MFAKIPSRPKFDEESESGVIFPVKRVKSSRKKSFVLKPGIVEIYCFKMKRLQHAIFSDHFFQEFAGAFVMNQRIYRWVICRGLLRAAL